MKYQVLFSLKKAKVFMNVVCCSCDWHLKAPLPCFSATVSSNVCDFTCASLVKEAFLKWGLFLEERICSYRANSFL